MQVSDIARASLPLGTGHREAPRGPPSNTHDVVTTGQQTTLDQSRPLQNSPVRAAPKIDEAQWRAMGFDSEEQARLTLGDDLFGGPSHVRARDRQRSGRCSQYLSFILFFVVRF